MDASYCIPVLNHPDARSGSFDKEELEHNRRRSLEMSLPQENEKGNHHDLPISPNEFYQFCPTLPIAPKMQTLLQISHSTHSLRKRQSRFTLPESIVGRLRDENAAAHSARDHPEEMLDLLILSNQIRAFCQKDKGRTKSAKHLQQRMVQLNVCSLCLSPH